MKGDKGSAIGLDPSLYVGRGQTYAKHILLKQYLEALAYKVLQSPSAPQEFLYIDGFSGPWQSQGEQFEDTSFSISLSVLTRVQEHLAANGRVPRIKAVFVEENSEAFALLRQAVSRFPQIEILTIQGRFEDQIAEITSWLTPSTFMFAFLDPCGWTGIALNRIKPLIAHRWSEVLVNLMTNSLVRHVKYEPVKARTAAFFGGGEWKSELHEAETRLGSLEMAIVEVYLRRLRNAANFKYVATTRIRVPGAGRTYFHLAYGTRHPAGMDVFRSSEKSCVGVQEGVASETYHERRERSAGTPDLFRDAENDGSIAAFQTWQTEARAKAQTEFDDWLHNGKSERASHWRALLMQHPYVDRALVNGWMRTAVKAGLLRSERRGSDHLWIPLHGKTV